MSARHRVAADRADDGGRGRPGQGQGSAGSSPATSAGPPRRCCRASGSATSSRTRRSSTWSCGARRTPARACPGVEGLLIDTPDGGHVRLGDVATVRVRADPAGHRAPRTSPASSTSRPTSRATTSARWPTGSRRSSRPVDYPARVPRRAAGGLLARAGRTAAHPRLRPRRRASASSCSCRPRSRAGGWAPSPSRPWSWPSRAASSPHGSTAVRSAWPPSPACSPCSALTVRQSVALLDRYRRLRTEDGMALGARAGHARRAGAGHAHRHLDGGDPRGVPARHLLRVHRGPGDPPPDGPRRGRRPHHVGHRQPVRAARRSTCASHPGRSRSLSDFGEDVHAREPELATAGTAGS